MPAGGRRGGGAQPAGPCDSPAAIITRGHGQRRASPGGQPQGAAAQRAREGREGGEGERGNGGRKEGRAPPVSAYLAVSASALGKTHRYSHPVSLEKKKKKKKINTAAYNPSATKLNFNISVFNCSRSHSSWS